MLTLFEDEFKDTNIRSAGVMGAFPLNAYLLPEHADLAPKMSAVIKEMKAEGLIERYHQRAMDAMKARMP